MKIHIAHLFQELDTTKHVSSHILKELLQHINSFMVSNGY